MSAQTDAKTITITRVFDAPPDLVFDCFTKPEHLIHWYSAGNGWTTPHARTDSTKGGRFNIGFADPQGKNSFDFTGTYDEVTPPSAGKKGRLAFTIDDGRPVTVDFIAENGKTRVDLVLTLETTHSEEQQRHGWGAMLANLETYLAKRSA